MCGTGGLPSRTAPSCDGMSDLSDRILAAAPPQPDGNRITRQIRHIERALLREENERRRSDLYAAYRALNWARSPDAFAPPVQESI